jgi:ArsR family transcriptional regulator
MNNEEASKLLSLLSDPNRLLIVTLLKDKHKMAANEFLSSLTCKQATLSHHLTEMAGAGLLTFKKKGNKIFYSMNNRKYNELLNFLGKLSQKEKEEIKEEPKVEVEEEKKEVYRVVDSDIIKPDPVKIELPVWLL